MLELEVLVRELLAVDGLAARSLTVERGIVSGRLGWGERHRGIDDRRTLPRVKSPPWSMNCGMIRWKTLPLKPNPLSPVQRERKLSVVFGTTSS